MRVRPLLRMVTGLMTLVAMCGCASTKPGIAPAQPAAARPAASDLGDKGLSDAIGLLYKGDAAGARPLLLGVLKRHPKDPTASSLLAQIDDAPEVLLGAANFTYVSRPGDSLSLLAERFLGDPILFYALARYNHIETPGVLEPGRTLRIPGYARAEPPRAPRSNGEAKTVGMPAKPAEAKPPAASAVQAADPTRAKQLRAAGLEQMNRGAIDRAVSLFQEASRLDPTNPLIQHDLERALRISRAVHAKS